MVGHFGVEKILDLFKNIFIGQNFDMTSKSISYLALLVPFPRYPSISKAYTPLFLFSRSLGNPSQWISCIAFSSTKQGNDYVCGR
jgi:hypothetical protein